MILQTPQHIAFIMDGNGRWAQDQGLPRSFGHKAGFNRIPEVLETCFNSGVSVVSIFVWSTENWSRPQAEVQYLMTELRNNLKKFIAEIHKKGIRFYHIGIKENLDPALKKALLSGEQITRKNQKGTFNFLFNYGSRDEILDTIRRIVEKFPNSKEFSEKTISDELWTAGSPDVDILIRTGGEKRLSNFMIWQCAQANLFFLDKYWPDINKKDIKTIIDSF